MNPIVIAYHLIWTAYGWWLPNDPRGVRSITHPTWTGGLGWKVFLEHPDEIQRTIPYIKRNPREIGEPEQTWTFATEYDGWPLHPGHSPNSPYVERLRAAGRCP